MIDLSNEVKQVNEALALDWYKNDGYTDIGSAVCNIKYGYIKNRTLSDEKTLQEVNYLVEQLLPFVNDCNIILPVPSFNPYHKANPNGDLKIMYMIADSLGKACGKDVGFSILKKLSSNQAKDSKLGEDDYVSEVLPAHIKTILLIDDLFGEGKTANYTVSALKKMNPNVFVRFISLTKNKYGGIHRHYDCKISKFDPYHSSDDYDDSIDLYFKVGEKNEKVRIWENHSRYENVKIAYENGKFDEIFEFSIYKNQKGYWQIADD